MAFLPYEADEFVVEVGNENYNGEQEKFDEEVVEDGAEEYCDEELDKSTGTNTSKSVRDDNSDAESYAESVDTSAGYELSSEIPDDIEEAVKNLKFSLFDRDVTEDHARYYLKTKSGDLTDDLTYLITAQIICNQMSEIKADQIQQAVQEHNTSIHCWSNKAIYCARMDDGRGAREAWQKILSLYKNEASRALAKIRYAFWTAERNRSEDHRIKACRWLESVAFREQKDAEMQPVIQHAAFLYMKILIRYAKSEFARSKDSDWFLKTLTKVVDLIIILIHSEKFEGEKVQLIWVWISEILTVSKFTQLAEKLDNQFSRLQTELDVPSVSFEICMEHLIQLCSSTYADSKILARAAKNATHYALTRHRTSGDPERALLLAIQLCKKSLEGGGHSYYMAKWSLGKCHMALWSWKLYRINKVMVDAENEALYRKPPASAEQARIFISSGLYLLKEENPDFIAKHLEEAHKHWGEMEERFGSERDRTCKLARLKYILGKPDDEVEETFKKAMLSPRPIDDNFGVVNAYQLFGRFYEKTGRNELAIEQYNEAVKSSAGNKGNPFVAKMRLQALQQGDNQRGRGGFRGRGGRGRGDFRGRGGFRGHGEFRGRGNFRGGSDFRGRGEYRGRRGDCHRGGFRGGGNPIPDLDDFKFFEPSPEENNSLSSNSQCGRGYHAFGGPARRGDNFHRGGSPTHHPHDYPPRHPPPPRGGYHSPHRPPRGTYPSADRGWNTREDGSESSTATGYAYGRGHPRGRGPGMGGYHGQGRRGEGGMRRDNQSSIEDLQASLRDALGFN